MHDELRETVVSIVKDQIEIFKEKLLHEMSREMPGVYYAQDERKRCINIVRSTECDWL